jgi:hypothetical protein
MLEIGMTKVAAGITTSVDGYITGPNDGPERGLGEGGEALRAGYVDELSISIAPVVLGAGKRLFDGFDTSVTLEPIRTYSSPLATHIKYRVVR